MYTKVLSYRLANMIACSLLYWTLGCDSKAELNDRMEASISKEALQVVDSAFDAIVEIDAKNLLNHFVSGPEATFTADGTIVSGHDSISNFFQTALASWSAVDSAEIKNVRVYVLANDAAVVTVNYSERVTEKNGNQFWNRGAWTSVLSKRDGQWKIVDSHASHPHQE